MNCLTMRYPLTLPAILRRAEALYTTKEIVSELPDRTPHRYTYRDMARRAKRLAVALVKLGVRPGERVATLCWNHHLHLEAYFGVTACGAVLHTLNLRLHANDLAYIVQHAEDQVVLVDEVLLPLLEGFRQRVPLRQVIVTNATGAVPPGMLEYEQLLAAVDEVAFADAVSDEDQPAGMCYTSGTTGQPKGVVYSHRALALHSMGLAMVDGAGVGEADVVFPLAPMFHANAWGLPFVCTLVGAKQVLSGPHFDPPHILRLLQDERVTISSGVPTIWLGVLQYLDNHPGKYDLSKLRRILIAGSAAPRSLVDGMARRHGLHMVQAWGMTEIAPIGTMCYLPGELVAASVEHQLDYRIKQGTPVAFFEIRARSASGLVPWDGQTLGELEVRGPWVSSAYYNCPEAAGSFTADGWFRTGDIVSIDARGCIAIQDRIKDLIKSGGEWISSVALENTLMGHPAVAEAAVVAVAHEKWQERPLAVVVLKEGQQATAEDLLGYLSRHFAKWWLPDAVVFIDRIPRTAAGKFLKKELRDRFQDYLLHLCEGRKANKSGA
jgi:fatty-acyl-CoA synthase